MRNYEVTILISSTNNKVDEIINFYKNIIINNNGIIHKIENYGIRLLSYNINKFKKAYYVVINITVSIKIIKKVENDLKLNSNIIRSLITKIK
ncbi:MAG: 30S ribosomal protein S6 [Candidatus Lightella neohaematopini]|nr:30S ribosomal protein S6 [Candidatus Lightella neohaematopini]MCV2528981.1 30S ribosomal protein S6 [Candidatus Lightella neohaematopini]